jgi:hypothetical protein
MSPSKEITGRNSKEDITETHRVLSRLVRASHVEDVVAARVALACESHLPIFSFDFFLLWGEPKGSTARMWL